MTLVAENEKREMRIRSSRVAEQMGLIARSLRTNPMPCAGVSSSPSDHTLVSLPGDSSVLLEEVEEEEDPNPTIPNSNISRCHHIPNSSIR